MPERPSKVEEPPSGGGPQAPAAASGGPLSAVLASTFAPRGRRFRVALSFAGEKRAFVHEAAKLLAREFTEERVLYDKFHEAEFARADLGTYLPDLYNKDADLVVVVVCPEYAKKDWTGLEWRAIHDLIKQRRDVEVMLCRFERASVTGLFGGAGWVELDNKSPREAVVLVLERLALSEGLPRGAYLPARSSAASPSPSPPPPRSSARGAPPDVNSNAGRTGPRPSTASRSTEPELAPPGRRMALSPRTALLTANETTALVNTELRACQPFRNLWRRYTTAAEGAFALRWVREREYRERADSSRGASEEDSTHSTKTVSDRLMLFADAGEGTIDLLLVMVVSSPNAPAGRHGTRMLRRALVCDPHMLVGSPAFLTSIPASVYLPWLWPEQPIEFLTFPFVQRNPDIHGPSAATLSMTFDGLSPKFGPHRSNVRRSSRIVPDSGLRSREIIDAIADAGLIPVEYRLDRSPDPSIQRENAPGAITLFDAESGRIHVSLPWFLELLHSYVDSGVPVVLVLGRQRRERDESTTVTRTAGPDYVHSVVVIGHTQHDLHAREALPMSQVLGFRTTTSLVREWVVHDAEVGPYLLLDSRGSGPSAASGDSRLWLESVEESAVSAFVALPSNVRHTVDRAYHIVRHLLYGAEWVSAYDDFLSSRRQYLTLDGGGAVTFTPPGKRRWTSDQRGIVTKFLQARRERTLVASVTLDSSDRVRRSAASESGLDQRSKNLLMDLAMPEFVYVVEIMLMDEASRGDESLVVGEALIDATVPADDDGSLLFIRFPGMLIVGGVAWRMSVATPTRRRQWTHGSPGNGRADA